MTAPAAPGAPFNLPTDEWRKRSGVLALHPELAPLLGEVRARFTQGGNHVPPHVTLLYPFFAPPEVDDHILERITRSIEGVPGFTSIFSRVGRFTQGICYLAPDDPSPYVLLSERVQAEFPEMPLYDGTYADIVPHVTFFKADLADDPETDEAEAVRAVSSGLPVTVVVRDICLTQRVRPDPAPWDVTARFELQ